MTYLHQPKVNPDIAEKSKRDIDAVNAYIDGLKGTILSIQVIRSGQARAYADSVTEAIIFAHQPNVFTTNGPSLRLLSKDSAKALAKIFLGDFTEEPKFLETRLTSLEPVPNPVGMAESKRGEWAEKHELHSAWRIVITTPYND